MSTRLRIILAAVLAIIVIIVLAFLLQPSGRPTSESTKNSVNTAVQTLFAQTAIAQANVNNNVQVNITTNAQDVQVNFPTASPITFPGVYQYGLNILELYTDGTFRWASMWDTAEEGRYQVMGDMIIFDFFSGKHTEHHILTHTNEVLYLDDGLLQFRYVGPAKH